jgi:hypothetical protein
MLAKSTIEIIYDEGFEIAFSEGVKLEDDDSEIDSMATSF